MKRLSIKVVAGTASKTTTGVERGIDVDFVLTIDGEEVDGEVTLLPHEDGRPGYGAWGDADHWVESNVLGLIRALDHYDYRQVLSEIEAACAVVADAFAAEVAT